MSLRSVLYKRYNVKVWRWHYVLYHSEFVCHTSTSTKSRITREIASPTLLLQRIGTTWRIHWCVVACTFDVGLRRISFAESQRVRSWRSIPLSWLSSVCNSDEISLYYDSMRMCPVRSSLKGCDGWHDYLNRLSTSHSRFSRYDIPQVESWLSFHVKQKLLTILNYWIRMRRESLQSFMQLSIVHDLSENSVRSLWALTRLITMSIW